MLDLTRRPTFKHVILFKWLLQKDLIKRHIFLVFFYFCISSDIFISMIQKEKYVKGRWKFLNSDSFDMLNLGIMSPSGD